MSRSLAITLSILVPGVAIVAIATAKLPAKTAADTIPWLDDLDSGLKAASRSRRPVFLVTLWGAGT